MPCVVVSVLPFADDAGELVERRACATSPCCLLALAVGDVVRSQRRRWRARGRREAERAQLGEERLRIAREVHDVVAHAMVAINVQAGVAAHLIDARPGAGARRAARDQGRPAARRCADLRATLGVLRGDDDAAPVRAAAGLGDLDELAGALRAAGVDVRLEVGELGGCPRRPRGGLPDRAGGADQRAAPRAARRRVRVRGRARGRRRARGGRRRRRRPRRQRRASGAGNGLRGMRERADGARRHARVAARADGGGWRGAARCRWRTRRDHASRSPTTRRSCARASARCSTRRTDIEVVAEAADGEEAVELARRAPARRRADGRADAAHRRAAGDGADHRRPDAHRARA